MVGREEGGREKISAPRHTPADAAMAVSSSTHFSASASRVQPPIGAAAGAFSSAGAAPPCGQGYI